MLGHLVWVNGLERKSVPLLPEEKARVKIDKQLRNAGWDIVARNVNICLIAHLLLRKL